MEEKKSNIDIPDQSSEAIRDVIGKMPPAILKWGLSAILFLVLLLLIFSWVIKYPDLLQAHIVITSTNPPVSAVAESDGRILLKVQDNHPVKKGDILGIIENPANAEDVFYVRDYLLQLQAGYAQLKDFPVLPCRANLVLGDIQVDFASFQKLYADYLFYRSTNSQQNEILSSRQRIDSYTHLLKKYRSINDLSARDADLTKTDFERNKTLKEGKVISDKDFEGLERTLIEANKNKETEEINALNADLRLSELQTEIRKYQIELKQNMELYSTNLQESMKKILAGIAAWEYKYVLKSVVSGKSTFLNIWKNNQYVKKGDIIMVIVPNDATEIIGKATTAVQNSGKIKPGQQVNIKLDSHPYYEFGMLKGTIESISQVPDNNNLYMISVRLPEKLETTYNQTIPFSAGLEGTAEIITDNRRLIERLLFRIKKSWAR